MYPLTLGNPQLSHAHSLTFSFHYSYTFLLILPSPATLTRSFLLSKPSSPTQPFLPGAIVRYDGSFHVVSDPFRRPQVQYNQTSDGTNTHAYIHKHTHTNTNKHTRKPLDTLEHTRLLISSHISSHNIPSRPLLTTYPLDLH